MSSTVMYSSCEHVSQMANFSLDDIIARNSCQMCGSNGPNLWVCVTDSCDLFTACGEGKSDHSTQHYHLNRSHRLTLNSTTFRIWCYECQTEIFIDNTGADQINEANNQSTVANKRKPILANQVYVADITDEESSDEEEVLIGLWLKFK